MHTAVPHSVTIAATTARPLHSLPADSAIATLCKHLLESVEPHASRTDRNNHPEYSVASSAAVLARSPWIAAADWEPVLDSHMHEVNESFGPAATCSAARVQLELLNMVLVHGHHASTGLARWLGLVAESAQRWDALPLYVRIRVFTSLSRAVENVSPTAQSLLLRCAERAATNPATDTDMSALLLKCAVA